MGRPIGSYSKNPSLLNGDKLRSVRAQIQITTRLLRQAYGANVPDMYRLLGEAEESLHDADKMLCSLPDESLGINKVLAAAR